MDQTSYKRDRLSSSWVCYYQILMIYIRPIRTIRWESKLLYYLDLFVFKDLFNILFSAVRAKRVLAMFYARAYQS